MFFQAREIEQTQIMTQSGDDVVQAGAGFVFLPVDDATSSQPIVDPNADPSLFSTWGIDLGDLEQGAMLAQLEIHGGPGDDRRMFCRLHARLQSEHLQAGQGRRRAHDGRRDCRHHRLIRLSCPQYSCRWL